MLLMLLLLLLFNHAIMPIQLCKQALRGRQNISSSFQHVPS